MKRTGILSAVALAALLVGPTVGAETSPKAKPSPEAQEASATPAATAGPYFIDQDGDGVCDRWSDRGRRAARSGRQGGGGFGPGDGSGYRGAGPRDGSGYGHRRGNCDGTSPKGRGRRAGRR